MVGLLAIADISDGTMARIVSLCWLKKKIIAGVLSSLCSIMLPSPYTLCFYWLGDAIRISSHLTIENIFSFDHRIIFSSYHLMLLLVGRGHRREDGAQLNLHRDSPWIRIQIQIHIHWNLVSDEEEVTVWKSVSPSLIWDSIANEKIQMKIQSQINTGAKTLDQWWWGGKVKRIINLRLKPKFFFPPLSSTQYWSILSHVLGQRRDLSRIFTNQLNSGNLNEIVFMYTWSIETSSQG